MKQYVTTNLVSAKPLTRLEYNQYRGWTLPENENGDDMGYLIEDKESKLVNDNRHTGYITWLPAQEFETKYQSLGDVENLPPHFQRVIAEKVLLDGMLNRLSNFIESDIFETAVKCENDRNILTRQKIYHARIQLCFRATY